jgi:hypothetical protein
VCGKDVISNFGWGRKAAVRIVNSRGVCAPVRENLNAAPLWSRRGDGVPVGHKVIERGYVAILGEWKESERDTNGSLRSEDHGVALKNVDRMIVSDVH